jgi:NAD+ synthase
MGYDVGLQQEIVKEMKVIPNIVPEEEITKRVNFLRSFLRKSGLDGFVLGMSGGQDSTLSAKLAQMAATAEGKKFVAMKLPYGIQKDAEDVNLAVEFVQPDQCLDFNIKPAVDALSEMFTLSVGKPIRDYYKGNIKARMRMVAQYAVAGEMNLAVIGTDHAAENLMGFFTKHGDGAADILPLYGLSKSQGAQMLVFLGCPERLYTKAPTADLLDDTPCRPDEDELGISYATIDSFLHGQMIPQREFDAIICQYTKTQHKRKPPITLYDWEDEHEPKHGHGNE